MSKYFFEALSQIEQKKQLAWFLKYDDTGDIIEITNTQPATDHIVITRAQAVELKNGDVRHWQIKNKQLSKKPLTTYKKQYTELIDVVKEETGTVFLDNNPYWPAEKIVGKGKKWSYESA